MLNLALLGCGRIGQVHARSISQLAGSARLVAVADAYEPAAQELATATGAEVRSSAQIMQSSDIDAVIIGTPTDTHYQLIHEAAAAEKAIFCEKPIDMSAERIRACIKATTEANVAFLTAFNHKSMLKAEQWWILTQTQFRSRDAFNRWIPSIAMTHLADTLQINTLRTPKNGTTSKQDLISIQEFLKTGTLEEHQKKLSQLMQRLTVIQLSGSPKTARLVRDYRAILELYLGQKTKLNLRSKPSARKALLQLTLQKLDELDIIFADLQDVHKSNKASGKHISEPDRDVD